MKKSEIKELAISEQESKNALLALTSEFAGETFVQVRQEIRKIPRLKLGQAMSPAVASGFARPGDFFIELTGQNLGSEVRFIPVLIRESASLVNQAGQKICGTRNLITNENGEKCSQCPHNAYWKDWGTKENPKTPACKASFDVLGLIEGVDIPVVFSFRKESYKAGKVLVDYTSYDPMRVPFGTVYTLKSALKPKDSFRFHIVDHTNIERQTIPQDVLQKLLPEIRSIVSMSKARDVVVEEEHDI